MSGRVRFTATALDHLSGSQAWVDVNRGVATDDAEVREVFTRLIEAPARKDGSVHLVLTPAEAAVLLIYAEAWETGAGQNIGGWSPTEGLGELNAARALVRNLAAVKE